MSSPHGTGCKFIKSEYNLIQVSQDYLRYLNCLIGDFEGEDIVQNPKRENFVIFLILATISIVMLISAMFIPAGGSLGFGADFMPKIVAGLLLVCSLGFLIQSIRAPKQEKSDEKKKFDYVPLMRFGIALGLLVLYVALLKSVGFVIMTALYIFAQSLFMVPREKRSILKSAILGIATSLIIYFVFTKGLNMVLPLGILDGIL